MTNTERSTTYTERKTNILVREKAKTLLNKSEDGSGPGAGQLEYNVVQGVSCRQIKYVLSKFGSVLSYLLIIKGITIF